MSPLADIQMPISYDWFLLISRVSIALIVIAFLARVAKIVANEALSARPAPGIQVVSMDGAHAVRLIRSRPLEVGRDAGCDMVLGDPSVSSRHARLHFEQGQWWLTDLGSTNGTWLNGARVAEPMSIESGDVVQFGRIDVLITDLSPDG